MSDALLERIAISLEKIAANGATLTTATTASTSATDAPSKAASKAAAKANGAAAPATNGSAATAAAPASTATSAAPAAATAASTTPATPTFEEARAALVGVKTKFGAEASRTIMQSVGAATATEIKPADFAKVIAACDAKMGAAMA